MWITPSSSSLLSSLDLSDTKVYEPYIRALLGTTSPQILNPDTPPPNQVAAGLADFTPQNLANP